MLALASDLLAKTSQIRVNHLVYMCAVNLWLGKQIYESRSAIEYDRTCTLNEYSKNKMATRVGVQLGQCFHYYALMLNSWPLIFAFISNAPLRYIMPYLGHFAFIWTPYYWSACVWIPKGWHTNQAKTDTTHQYGTQGATSVVGGAKNVCLSQRPTIQCCLQRLIVPTIEPHRL